MDGAGLTVVVSWPYLDVWVPGTTPKGLKTTEALVHEEHCMLIGVAVNGSE